jgi:hypothetical protein
MGPCKAGYDVVKSRAPATMEGVVDRCRGGYRDYRDGQHFTARVN